MGILSLRLNLIIPQKFSIWFHSNSSFQSNQTNSSFSFLSYEMHVRDDNMRGFIQQFNSFPPSSIIMWKMCKGGEE